MTLQQLRCICAVVDHGFSVSIAAQKMRTTQPGVSKMLAALESELGLRVFVRRGNRLVGMTQAGQEAIAIVRRILADSHQLQGIASGETTVRARWVRIGTSHFHARYALMPTMRRFRKAYPNVTIVLSHGSSEQILTWVAAGEVDLGIITLPDDIPANVVHLPAYTIERCLIVPPAHPLLAKRHVRIEDVAQYPLIIYDEHFNAGWVVQKEFQRRGVTPQVAIKATDASVVKACVAAGLGIAILQKTAFVPKKDFDLRMIATDHIFPPSTAKISIRRDQPPRDHVCEFIRCISRRWSRAAIESAMRAGEEGSGVVVG